jgi:hypothetical protein
MALPYLFQQKKKNVTILWVKLKNAQCLGYLLSFNFKSWRNKISSELRLSKQKLQCFEICSCF